MKPLLPRDLASACHSAERSQFWTTQGENDVARNHAQLAIVKLARALGVEADGIEAIRLVLEANEKRLETDFARAAERREVVVESEKPGDHLRQPEATP